MRWIWRYYSDPNVFERQVEEFLAGFEFHTGSVASLPVPVENIAEDYLGYRIRFDDLRWVSGVNPGSSVRGMLLEVEKRILVDSSCRRLPHRFRFTLAHEIGHVVLGHANSDNGSTFLDTIDTLGFATTAAKGGASTQLAEAQANRFAASLLIPRNRLMPKLQSLTKVDINEVVSLARTFGVSPRVMIIHLQDLQEDDLLYTLTSDQFPNRLLVDLSALADLKGSMKERNWSKTIGATVPPERDFRNSLRDRSRPPAPITVIDSDAELAQYVEGLAKVRNVVIALGGLKIMSPESFAWLEDMKAEGKAVVPLCADPEQAIFLSAFGGLIHCIIRYTALRDGVDPELPGAVASRVAAYAEKDKWLRRQLLAWDQISGDYKQAVSQNDVAVTSHTPRVDDVTGIDYVSDAQRALPAASASPAITVRGDPINHYRGGLLNEIVRTWQQLSLWTKEQLHTIPDAILYRRAAKRARKKTVLFTGCYDLLHIGHVTALQNAKNDNEVLLVGVEDDLRTWQFKGRFINNIENRCRMLGALSCVDFVFVISDRRKHPRKWLGADFYEYLCRLIKPDFRAIHDGDPIDLINQKRAQIEASGGQLRIISDYTREHSTTNDFFKKLLSDEPLLASWTSRKSIVSYQSLIDQGKRSNGTHSVRKQPEQLRIPSG